MIRFQLTTTNPIAMNSAAKILTDHPRLEIEKDSGNKNGCKKGYIRYLHAKILNKTKPKPKHRLDDADKIVLANQCWQHIVHKTDADEDAVQAIIKLIEYVERKCL